MPLVRGACGRAGLDRPHVVSFLNPTGESARTPGEERSLGGRAAVPGDLKSASRGSGDAADPPCTVRHIYTLRVGLKIGPGRAPTQTQASDGGGRRVADARRMASSTSCSRNIRAVAESSGNVDTTSASCNFHCGIAAKCSGRNWGRWSRSCHLIRRGGLPARSIGHRAVRGVQARVSCPPRRVTCPRPGLHPQVPCKADR